LENLRTEIDKIKECIDQSIQTKVIELSQHIIDNTVKAVCDEFSKKQSDLEKLNTAKLDSLGQQISQLYLVLPRTSQACEAPVYQQVHLAQVAHHQELPAYSQHPQDPPLVSSKKKLYDKRLPCKACGKLIVGESMRDHLRKEHP